MSQDGGALKKMQDGNRKPQTSIKLVIIGDSGVGKTSLRNQYLEGQFSTGYRATIGADFITKSLPHHSEPEESVTLQIWDTAGQERFSGLSSAFFRGADAVMLMFDVNRPETLQSLHKWWHEFKDRAPVADEEAEEFCCVVVGNKIDLAEGRKDACGKAGPSRVSESEAESFLEELIPRIAVVPEEEEEGLSEEGDPLLSTAQVEHEESKRVSIFSFRPSWSGFSLRSGHDTSTFETPTIISTSPPQWSPPQPFTDQSSQPEPIGKRSSGKSRSSERSLFGGTVASGRSMYHTPSSSLFESDVFESALSTPQSPTRMPSRASEADSLLSTPTRLPRRMASSASTSSALTITPSLFVRTRATSSASQTPPTPPDIDSSGDYLFTPPPRHRRRHTLPPRPERRPRLFLASAKTGSGIGPIFEHIANRVQMQWAYNEAVESLRSPSQSTEVDVIRLSASPSFASDLRERWESGTSTCCSS